jgi:hypothetical protein
MARQAAAPPIPPPLPADTAELIRALPEATDPHWAQMAAEDVVRKFGGKDRELWGQWHAVMDLIWRGRLDPEHMVNAMGQGLKPGIERPGAKAWAALQALAGIDEHDLKGGGT